MTAGASPKVTVTIDDLASSLPVTPTRRAVVMTMGGLHEGHAELMRIARERVGDVGHVTATIFVNPLQFSASEDLDKYPRTFDSDLGICSANGVDLVFAPSPSEMYPAGQPRVTIDPGEAGQRFEGAARPDHFRGVLTVVNILLALTNADIAVFGEKDYQQLTLIRRMVSDLRIPVEIVAAPIVRESNGIAMSSRNRYLSDAAVETARRIPAAIEAGRQAADRGVDAVIAATTRVLTDLEAAASIDIEYVAVTDPLMGPLPSDGGPARLIVTVIVDGTRLLDNAALVVGPTSAAGAP